MTLPVIPQFIAQGYRAMMAGRPDMAAEAFASQPWNNAAQIWTNPVTDAWRETGKPAGESWDEYVTLLRGASPNCVQYIADRVSLRAERFGSSGDVLTLLRDILRETRRTMPRTLPAKETWKNLRHKGLRKAFKNWLGAAHHVPSLRDTSMIQTHRQLMRTIEKAMEEGAKTDWFGRLRNNPLPENLERIVAALYLSLSDPRIGDVVADDFPSLAESLRKNGFLEEDFFQTILERARHDLTDPISLEHEKTLALFLEKNDPKPLLIHRPQISIPLPAEILEYVEDLSGYDHTKRIQALEILKERVPDLPIPQRWEGTLQIGKKLFLPTTSGAFRRSYEALLNCLSHLEWCPELPDFLEMIEEGITNSDPHVRRATRWTLRTIAPHIPVDEKTFKETVDILNIAAMDSKKLKKQIVHLAYAYGNTLSYGAIRALILAGQRLIVDGNWNRMGDQLKNLGDRWQKEEKRYRGHPTLGGKIRKEKGNGEEWGYPSGPRHLIRGENQPILLYPVGSPEILTRTLWDLAWSDPENGPLNFRFSLALSGKVDNDLHPAVFGVYSLLRSIPVFPVDIAGEAGITGYAPIVEGGGYVTDLHQLGNVDEEGRLHRYDYLFLGFTRPPKNIEFFDTAGVWNSQWVEAMNTFLQESRPRLLSLDTRNHTLEVAFDFKGTSQTMDWKPTQKDWETLVAGHDKKVFERFFFLEWARRAFFDEISNVIESAWVLGMLRENEKGEESFLPFSEGFTETKRRRLMALASRYRNEIRRFFQEAGITDVLETNWIGNDDWQTIRQDQLGFQEALKNLTFRDSVRGLVHEIIYEAREILLH